MTSPRGDAARRTYTYLLGDAGREAARLRAQARLWDPVTLALFDRIGIRRSAHVLEIGPGQGSLHRELRRRAGGPVDAIEPSAPFRARLHALAARDGLGEGRVWDTYLADVRLPRGHYDVIFARWVFLFLPDAEGHVRKLAAALRPGGVLAIQDYCRETFLMVPTPPEWRAFVAADEAFIGTHGGDASIAGKLPAMYRKAGLDVVDLTPTIKTGRPGSPEWTWLTTYFFSVMDEMARFAPFSRVQAKRLRRHWMAASRDKTSVLIAPAVFDVIGRRPKTRTSG
ncbi:MAG TPA: methyltransferase domain-containing protein [Vicinamibacterales bacterium]